MSVAGYDLTSENFRDAAEALRHEPLPPPITKDRVLVWLARSASEARCVGEPKIFYNLSRAHELISDSKVWEYPPPGKKSDAPAPLTSPLDEKNVIEWLLQQRDKATEPEQRAGLTEAARLVMVCGKVLSPRPTPPSSPPAITKAQVVEWIRQQPAYRDVDNNAVHLVCAANIIASLPE